MRAVWDRADEFLPERFALDAPVPTEQNTDYKYIPFRCGQCEMGCWGCLKRGGGDLLAHLPVGPAPHTYLSPAPCPAPPLPAAAAPASAWATSLR